MNYHLKIRSSAEVSRNLIAMNIVTASCSSINRDNHLLNFEFNTPKQRQSLTNLQKTSRIAFVYYVLAAKEDFGGIIFSDESRVALNPDKRWM
jgi:hypothetical protein